MCHVNKKASAKHSTGAPSMHILSSVMRLMIACIHYTPLHDSSIYFNELIESVSQGGQRGSLHHHGYHQHRVVHQTRSGGAYWDDFMLEVRLTAALWQKWVQHGAFVTSTACISSRWQHTPLSQPAPQHGVVTHCPVQGVPLLCGV